MTLTLTQRRNRLRQRLKELPFWLDRATFDLEGWRFNGEPLALGQPWPQRGGVNHLQLADVSMPEGWPLADTVLELNPGGESLLHILYPDGEESFGIDPNHRRFPLRDRQFSLELESVARLPFGAPNRDARLAVARLVYVDRALQRLNLQLGLVLDAAETLEGYEVESELLAVAERALAELDWPSGTESVLARTQRSKEMLSVWQLPPLPPEGPGLSEEQRATVEEASRRLERDLRRLQYRHPAHGRLALTGHAHIDLAWLWPMAETRRKAQRTFHTAVSLLERDETFHFTQSTAQLYAFLERDDPALFERIRRLEREGRWETIGGTWVEPDTNLPSGESLARQLLYGQRYFQRTFGRTHDVCWLPDCFGFSPALPQLLRLAGIDTFFTIKLTWNETNSFPYDLFRWEGLDGTQVLAHLFDNPDGGYNGNPRPQAIQGTWENFRGKQITGENLLSIGYGDGGGGVTPEMLEEVRVLQNFPALPAVQFDSARNFYQRTRQAVRDVELPIWTGEMYLELHRGTFTTQGRTKYLHRRAERDLVAAEVVGALQALAGLGEPASREEQWHAVLRNEFHDILPGSSIREVYEQANAELSEVVDRAGALIADGMDALAQAVLPPGEREALFVLNPDLSARPLRLELPSSFPGAQDTESGSVLSGDGLIPGLGTVSVLASPPAGAVEVSSHHLENAYLRVTLDENGLLTSVYDKQAGREVLGGRGNQLWVYVDKPRAWDAWDIDAGYPEQGEEITALDSIRVLEAGPHRVAVRLERTFRQSRITQDIRLWSNSPRLEFKTTLDWHDRHWLVRARFPLAVQSRHATFESAFGMIERPTHRNTSWEQAAFEVVAHRFVDLSEPGFGVALLNDGKYGHDVSSNSIGISLLRSPTHPDPLADEGLQTFTYALLPHQGSWLAGGVLAEAEDLNRPLLAQPIHTAQEVIWQPLRVAGLPAGLGTLKGAEDGGGLVLRVYEPQGARGALSLTLPPGWEIASEIDLLERPIGTPDLTLQPFQVRSWLLRQG